jgi:hypothetical protein
VLGPWTDRGKSMERMLCAECAAVSYSAAAKTLVESGERCPRCGGPLMMEEAEPAGVTSKGGKPAPKARI